MTSSLAVMLLLGCCGCRRTTTPQKTLELLGKRAEVDMSSFIRACQEYRTDNGTFPSDSSKLYGRDSYLIRPVIADPWETRYKYVVSTNYVSITSAGPDKQWGTIDDLHRESPVK